jgi:aconitate hydratase
LAFTFSDPAHYDLIREDDRLDLVDLNQMAEGKPVECVIRHSDGTKDSLHLKHTYSKAQIEWFKAGSALNLMT